jgi:hypothetical protein
MRTACQTWPVPGDLPRRLPRGIEADVADIGYRMTTTPASTLPDAWAAGQGIPGQRPTRQH